MRILVIGSGAREHALLRALDRDPDVGELHVAPGNAGTGALAVAHPLDVGDPEAIAGLARELAVDLVVIGPEMPLVAGAVDRLWEAGIAAFGPSAAAARIEGSKAFAKEVMAAAGVPTARAVTVIDAGRLAPALRETGAPYVVKDDGLAAGKGVVVTSDQEVAMQHGLRVLAAGHPVLVEEFLEGPEVSVFGVCDGRRALPLLPAQDYKRLGDADTGPNTGGMGAYAPLPWAPTDLIPTVQRTVLDPVLAELARRGTPFAGLLYAGLVLTADGPKVIEFNCRFGDPESQVVLELLDSPLGELLAAAAVGNLEGYDLRWRQGAAVTVVIAAEGYPGSPIAGDVIGNLPADAADAVVLHAGTSRRGDGAVVSAGGRVLSATAVGSDLAEARKKAYGLVDQIELRGSQHRSDIAEAAAAGTSSMP